MVRHAFLAVLLVLGGPAARAQEGRYLSKEGVALTVTRAPAGGGYRFRFVYNHPTCAAGVVVEGRFQGSTLATSIGRGEPDDDESDDCALSIARQGRALAVIEKACSSFHGVHCSFGGIYRPAR